MPVQAGCVCIGKSVKAILCRHSETAGSPAKYGPHLRIQTGECHYAISKAQSLTENLVDMASLVQPGCS